MSTVVFVINRLLAKSTLIFFDMFFMFQYVTVIHKKWKEMTWEIKHLTLHNIINHGSKFLRRFLLQMAFHS